MTVRHFDFVDRDRSAALFHVPPEPLDASSDPSLLATGLGATLYAPGTRPDLPADARKQAARGLVSMVLCLEDSVPDEAVPGAEANVIRALHELHAAAGPDAPPIPLLFVRVRDPEQLVRVAEGLGSALDLLCGFVVPKYRAEDGYADAFFEALHRVHAALGQDGDAASGRRRLRIMGILESPDMIHAESRHAALTGIREVTRRNRDDVLSLRIGATDLSSAYGLRRTRDLTVYDVQLIASVIGDIVNALGRPTDDLVISGPVWEHFGESERILRPQLRVTPFREASDRDLRRRLLVRGFDALIREITLDRANGLTGKTVIHPSHVPVVHALSVVTHEEFLDAQAIVEGAGGGAHASPYRNKMNEMKPHRAWAHRTLLRARAFGVAAEHVTFVDFLEAGAA